MEDYADEFRREQSHLTRLARICSGLNSFDDQLAFTVVKIDRVGNGGKSLPSLFEPKDQMEDIRMLLDEAKEVGLEVKHEDNKHYIENGLATVWIEGEGYDRKIKVDTESFWNKLHSIATILDKKFKEV